MLKSKGGFKKIYSRFASANLLPSSSTPRGSLAVDPLATPTR